MIDLSYDIIEEALDGHVFGTTVDSDGTPIVLQSERIDGETVYTATWECHRTKYSVKYAKHWYRKDGTVEETFENEISVA